MSKSMAELATKLTRFGQGIERSQRAALTQGLLTIRNEELGQARRFSGDLRLSGVGRHGSKIGVIYKIKNNNFGFVRATGAWPIRDSSLSSGPVKPHLITSRYGGGSRISRARRLGGSARSRRGEASVGMGPTAGRGRGVGGVINIFGETSFESEGWRLYARHPGAPRQPYWAQGVAKISPKIGAEMHTRWVERSAEQARIA